LENKWYFIKYLWYEYFFPSTFICLCIVTISLRIVKIILSLVDTFFYLVFDKFLLFRNLFICYSLTH